MKERERFEEMLDKLKAEATAAARRIPGEWGKGEGYYGYVGVEDGRYFCNLHNAIFDIFSVIESGQAAKANDAKIIEELEAEITKLKRFPSLVNTQGTCLEVLDAAGMGVDESSTGNCLVDMIKEICRKFAAAKNELAAATKLIGLAKEFDVADEQAEWEPPHPIFQMAQDNDTLRVELATANKKIEDSRKQEPFDWSTLECYVALHDSYPKLYASPVIPPDTDALLEDAECLKSFDDIAQENIELQTLLTEMDEALEWALKDIASLGTTEKELWAKLRSVGVWAAEEVRAKYAAWREMK